MQTINPEDYKNIVFFTGAGMSAESGVPTYRGAGGVWSEYRWEEFACQEAFDLDPEKVLRFHELRRRAVLECRPHAGHLAIAELEKAHPGVTVVTQNIDGMHQRAGSQKVIELHGSLWRLRCPVHGVREDIAEQYGRYRCEPCGNWLRPDIVWFGDRLDQRVVDQAIAAMSRCDLFVSVGTSAVVYPAAGFPKIAKQCGAVCIEINPEPTELSFLYDRAVRQAAGRALPALLQKAP
jgi:NAD-dependent deacetylase